MVRDTCGRHYKRRKRGIAGKKRLTASDLYEIFVGEIGIPRREFLYEISLWEARRIMRGYNRRKRDLWSAVRWHAFQMMSAMPYCDPGKAGIHNPTDLLKLPWDNTENTQEDYTDEEIEETRKRLREANANKVG